MQDADYYLNAKASERLESTTASTGSPISFHRSLPGYEPTRLLACKRLAKTLKVAEVWVKEESNRFGLPAYKVLGASWAICNALRSIFGASGGRSLEDLRSAVHGSNLTLVAATDGNHGRAVARVARWLGLESEIFVPVSMAQVRSAALRGEGARVRVVQGSYDDAVREAAASEEKGRLLIQDTSWPGYERIPKWIVEGYVTIFQEVTSQLEDQGGEVPDLLFVQIGVGSLAAAATTFFHRLEVRPRIVGVEPLGADCLLRSARAGRSVTVAGPHTSVMAGLNCGTPSATSLPVLSEGMDAFLALPDERAFEAMRLLASEGVVAGESGAAGLAGLIEVLKVPELADYLGANEASKVLVLVTEADTDPEAYEAIVGRQSAEVRRTSAH